MELHFYVSGNKESHVQLVSSFSGALEVKYGKDNFSFKVIDVLVTPEVAVAYDVFATPMLVRILPIPMVKIIGKFTNVEKLLAVVEAWQNQVENQIIII